MTPARLLYAPVLIGLFLSAPPARAGVVDPAAGPPSAATHETALHRTLSVELVATYLRDWSIRHLEPADGALYARIRYKDRTHRFRFRVLPGDVLLVRVEEFIQFTRANLNFERFAARLLEENDRLVVGKFVWDSAEGQVALEHALVARDGLSFRDFTDVMVRLLVTADVKYPDLMRALWR